jgi:hypothetical protein
MRKVLLGAILAMATVMAMAFSVTAATVPGCC